MTKMQQLAELGQSVWLDFIRRSLIASGELQRLIERGLRGMTSNPSIFAKAIGGSDDYDDQLRRLAASDMPLMDLYEALAIEDIRAAADLFRPLYDRTDGRDGYVSLEADPRLADDTDGTLKEVRHLWATVDRPNLMVKVPATAAGIPAIRTLIAEGININVTLMFSLAHYDAVAEAYISGLEDLAERGGDLARVASVASFFVSRVDTAVDRELERIGNTDLQGKIAVANARLAYARFRETFSGERWERLAGRGARVQRPLWGSTSTKNPSYPDTKYVDELIGPNTVNTIPPETLQAFEDHGKVALTLEKGVDEARERVRRLSEMGIDLDAITEELQRDGVKAFADSFEDLLQAIEAKREKIGAGG
ncbi:MAG: transaldolase [Anaerolineae bacterium]|nr:transaldolase [Anaerolineae bacterium]